MIVYSCIARGHIILCSHQRKPGSFRDIANSMLQNISTNRDSKTTYTSDNFLFHCIIENGLVFMCAADPDLAKRQPYAYLSEIKRRFQSGSLAAKAITAEQHGLDKDFSFVLSREMEKFSKKGAGDSLNVLQSQVDEVKDVMTQNIDKVLERGDQLDELINKTTELEEQSASFQRTAKKIRKRYWWKNAKMTIIMVCVALVIIITIVLIILFSTHVLPVKSKSATPASSSPSVIN